MRGWQFLVAALMVFFHVASANSPWPLVAHDSQNSNRANSSTTIPTGLCPTFFPDLSYVGGILPTQETWEVSGKEGFLILNSTTLTNTNTSLDGLAFGASLDGKTLYYLLTTTKKITTVGAQSLDNVIYWQVSFPGTLLSQQFNEFADSVEVVVQSDEGTEVYHLSADNGATLWKASAPDSNSVAFIGAAPGQGNPIFSFYISDTQLYTLVCYNQSTGSQSWSLVGLQVSQSVVSDDGIVVIGSSVTNQAIAYSAANGSQVWLQNLTPPGSFLNLGLMEGNLTFPSPVVFYGSANVQVLDSATGNVLVQSPSLKAPFTCSSFAFAIKNTLFLMCESVYKVDLSDFTWTDPVLISPVECVLPAIRADGTVYATCSEESRSGALTATKLSPC